MFCQLALFDEVPSYSPVTPKVKATYDSLIITLIDDFDRHELLLTKGGSDPFWPDGVNLMLKRNHIIHNKKQFEGLNTIYNLPLPEVYSRPTPVAVDRDYQAPNSKSGRLYTFCN